MTDCASAADKAVSSTVTHYERSWHGTFSGQRTTSFMAGVGVKRGFQHLDAVRCSIQVLDAAPHSIKVLDAAGYSIKILDAVRRSIQDLDAVRCRIQVLDAAPHSIKILDAVRCSINDLDAVRCRRWRRCVTVMLVVSCHLFSLFVDVCQSSWFHLLHSDGQWLTTCSWLQSVKLPLSS